MRELRVFDAVLTIYHLCRPAVYKYAIACCKVAAEDVIQWCIYKEEKGLLKDDSCMLI